MNQNLAYERFRALARAGDAFMIPNAWDGVSAVLLKQAGFEALGSSSFAIAAALGRKDGRHAVEESNIWRPTRVAGKGRVRPRRARCEGHRGRNAGHVRPAGSITSIRADGSRTSSRSCPTIPPAASAS